MTNPTPPCKDCTTRFVGCRKYCDYWQDYEANKIKEQAEKDKCFRYAQDYQVYRENKIRRKYD